MSLTSYKIRNNWKITTSELKSWIDSDRAKAGQSVTVVPTAANYQTMINGTLADSSNYNFLWTTMQFRTAASSYTTFYVYTGAGKVSVPSGVHTCFVRIPCGMYYSDTYYSRNSRYTDSDDYNASYWYRLLSNSNTPYTFDSSVMNQYKECNWDVTSSGASLTYFESNTLKNSTGWPLSSSSTADNTYSNLADAHSDWSTLRTYLNSAGSYYSLSGNVNDMNIKYNDCWREGYNGMVTFVRKMPFPVFEVSDKEAILSFLNTGDESGKIIFDSVSRLKFGSDIYAIKDSTARTTAETANTNASSALSQVALKQDILTAGTNITIENNVISATGGSSYKEYTGTLTAGSTSLTIAGSDITTSSVVDVYYEATTTSEPLCYNTILVSAGSVTMTFDAQSADLNVKIRVS